jgi:hypothetical protein
METETPTCHNCQQDVTIPKTSAAIFHTCTKMETVRRGKQKIRVTKLGEAGPHFMLRAD